MDSVLAQYTEHLEGIVYQLGHASRPKADEDEISFDLLVGDGLATIVQIHDAHVHARKDTNSSVEALSAMKADYDNELLSLQNKRVEKMFYSRMISANNSFQSEFTDSDIGIRVDDQSANRPDPMGDSLSAAAHNATKKWLTGEAAARQQLSETKASLEEHQRKLTESNQLKRQKLSQAAANINEVISTCRPAFRHLNLSALQACDWNSMSQLPHLPTKLQALYYQIASASALETFPAQVEIEAERHSRKRKLGSQELQVRLTVFMGNSKTLLVFAYIPEMDVITARWSNKDVQHQHLLAALYPNDTGDSWPGDARPDAATLAHANARPYRWCQCLRAPAFEQDDASRLQGTIDFIAWFQARHLQVSLMWAHLRGLQNKSWPVGNENWQGNVFDSVKIVDWTLTQDVRMTPLVHISKDGNKEEGEVDEGDRDNVPEQETDLRIIHEGVIQLKRFDVSVRVQLTTSLMYPYRVPEFLLSNEHGNYFEVSSLADIEADVNVTAPLWNEDDPLPAQLSCLAHRLDAEL